MCAALTVVVLLLSGFVSKFWSQMAQVHNKIISLNQRNPIIEGGAKCSRNSLEGVWIDKHDFVCVILNAECYIF